jgi:hypothetical protein
MNLQDALLCIDCDWLYAFASSCPRCGSHVSYPIARAMDQNRGAVERMEWSAAAAVDEKPLPAPIPILQGKRGRLAELRHSA